MTTAPPTRVVVADDSGLMRRVLTHALTAAGFEVVGQAKDGDEALELCRRLRPDTMTLDLHMPGMDGIGVLRELKRPGAPSIPVIVVSAFSPAHGARAVDALSEGAFDLVAKPGAGDALSTFVAELSEKVRAAAGSLRRRIVRPAPAPAPAAAAGPPPPAGPPCGRRRGRLQAARLHRLLHGRPGRARAARAAAARPPRRRHRDRPAHAGGLHHLAGRPARQGLRARGRRGQARRRARARQGDPRPRRPAPAPRRGAPRRP